MVHATQDAQPAQHRGDALRLFPRGAVNDGRALKLILAPRETNRTLEFQQEPYADFDDLKRGGNGFRVRNSSWFVRKGERT